MISKINAFISKIVLIILTLFMNASCQKPVPLKIEKGVSISLNDLRNQQIENLKYDLFFSIPESKSEPIIGKITANFVLNDNSQPVVFDFSDSSDKIKQVKLNGVLIGHEFKNGHIIIPEKLLQKGETSVSVDFIAGNLSLNRNEDYLFTLFVPDRASSAFPCFDQPALKAAFKLNLEIPLGWSAVANGAITKMDTSDNRVSCHFAETRPISTYLFAFTTGKFSTIIKEKNGRSITMYHRETDQDNVDRNADEIFRLEFDALDWMEAYTGIKFPFQKFDFVAIPSFQYSGMEHPGAVLYRAEKLFLDPTATQEQILNRASLIAHETAHMWFGDFVTMSWFDDVWMKEVFANFMAAKIVNPAFPEIDHKLAFLTDHFPRAYAVDRTSGANPIRQKLNNLNMAGTLYGAIIYNKAPIVMQHLENITGKETLKTGLREYLNKYAYANADWLDLINILDRQTTTDLASWSDVWVNKPGMPVYNTSLADDRLTISETGQSDNKWPQQLNIFTVSGDQENYYSLFHDGSKASIQLDNSPDLVMLNGDAIEYGLFELTQNDLDFLLSDRIFTLNARKRSAAYISLWENMLAGLVPIDKMSEAFIFYLDKEDNEQAINLLLNYYGKLFWRYHDESSRFSLAEKMEPLLWEKILKSEKISLKSTYYKAFTQTVITKEGVKKMVDLWTGSLKVKGLNLTVDDLTTLSFELAVRDEIYKFPEEIKRLFSDQLGRVKNQDKKKRMEFIIPALDPDEKVRDAFFTSLADPANREHEPWILTALQYLNHPLRAVSAEKYLNTELNMVPEIQATGDIFFPKGWLDACFFGHHSQFAIDQINHYLNSHPKLDEKLRLKVLQSADPIMRSVRLMKK